MIGKTLLHYEITAKIGEGGMGIVYKAKDSKTSTLAAILNQEPAPFEAEVPHDLEKIIKRCLQKDPDKCFHHMVDVRVALDELKEESESGKLGATQAAGAVPLYGSITRLTGKKLIYIFGGLLILIVAYLALMREVRQSPRFKAFIRKIGLVDYWNKFGWPDICHQTEGGDFECN